MVAPFAVVPETFVVAVLAAFEAFANAEVAEESLEPVPMLDGSHLPIEVAAQYLRSLVTAVEAELGMFVLYIHLNRPVEEHCKQVSAGVAGQPMSGSPLSSVGRAALPTFTAQGPIGTGPQPVNIAGVACLTSAWL